MTGPRSPGPRAGWLAAVALLLFAASCGRPSGGAPNASSTDLVEWAWCGAVTPRSIRVHAKLSRPSHRVRLLVSPESELEEPLTSSYQATDPESRVISMVMTGLVPGTRYSYAVEVDGEVDRNKRGKFRTLREGPFSFTVAMGSCARTGSRARVFDAVRGHDPVLLIHLGDFHYENIRRNRRTLFRRAYDKVLASPAQARLFSNQPLVYTWDDHDFGGNDSDSTAPSRQAARLTYQEYVPHYPLAAGSGDVPIYHSFTVGRARFLVTDSRSERSPSSDQDNARKSMLGTVQKEWLKAELMAASEAGAVIFWISSVPWVAPASNRGDHWGAYDHERSELARFILDNEIHPLFILSGDAHMLAMDDGTHSKAGIPVMQAGAFDRRGSVKGGPYSEGTFPGGGQFGLMTVEDDGTSAVRITWSGRNHRDEELLGISFTVELGEPTP